jgi:cytoskeletal protein CcmA (bactofilin family)
MVAEPSLTPLPKMIDRPGTSCLAGLIAASTSDRAIGGLLAGCTPGCWAARRGERRKMTTENRVLEGDLCVDGELTLNGMVAGSITVVAGGLLTLGGMCGGDITIEEGAKAYLHGMVGGNVLNRGGHLKVYGMIGGSLNTTEEGKTYVDANAVIGNRR